MLNTCTFVTMHNWVHTNPNLRQIYYAVLAFVSLYKKNGSKHGILLTETFG